MHTDTRTPARGVPAWLAAPESETEQRFAAYHAANPHVYDEIERRALALLRAGRTRIGIKMIVEALRYDWAVQVDRPESDYRINNIYTALYARLLLHRRPELEDLIETRRAQVDEREADPAPAAAPLAAVLQQLSTDTRRHAGLWRQCGRLSGGLLIWMKYGQTGTAAPAVLLLQREQTLPSDLEVTIVLDALPAAGWCAGEPEHVEDRSAVRLMLWPACERCGGRIDNPALIYGDGTTCSRCRSRARFGGAPARYVDPGDQERGSTRATAPESGAPAGPDLFGGWHT